MKKPYTAPAVEKLGLVRVKNQPSGCVDTLHELSARTPVGDRGIASVPPVPCGVD